MELSPRAFSPASTPTTSTAFPTFNGSNPPDSTTPLVINLLDDNTESTHQAPPIVPQRVSNIQEKLKDQGFVPQTPQQYEEILLHRRTAESTSPSEEPSFFASMAAKIKTFVLAIFEAICIAGGWLCAKARDFFNYVRPNPASETVHFSRANSNPEPGPLYVQIAAPWAGSDVEPSPLPEHWEKHQAEKPMIIGYAGGYITIPQRDTYFTYQGKIAIGWHGSINPPHGR